MNHSLQHNSIEFIEELIEEQELKLKQLMKLEVVTLSSYESLIKKLKELVTDNNGHAFSLYVEGEIIELREEQIN
jgi:hypothetical protein